MPFSAFQTITAAALNRLTPLSGEATGTNLVLTTTETDLPAASVTLSTSAAGATYKVWAAFDMTTTQVGASGVGRLSVDGATQAGQAVLNHSAINNRGTIPWVWRGTLASAGSHTFKLRALKDVGGATTMNCSNSKIFVEISEVP